MTKLPAKTDNQPAWAAELTLRERAFAEQFIIDLNGRKAAIRAGLGKSVKSATEMASRMRRKASVAAAISALIAEKSGIVGSAVLGELGAIAYSRITDFLKLENGRLVLAVADLNELPDEAKAAIAKLRERVNDDGTISIEVELHDKLVALDKLGKSIGLFKDRQEISGPNGGPINIQETDPLDRIRERLSALRKAREAAFTAEFESPVARISPMAPQRAIVIDAEP